MDALASVGLEGARELEGPHPAGQRAVVAGRYSLGARVLELRVWVPVNFPLSLPVVLVDNHESLGFVPHLTAIGSICYHEGEGSVQSIWRPTEVIAEAFELALRVLDESLDAGDATGIVEEMEWWWSRQRGCWQAWTSTFEPGGKVKGLRRLGAWVFNGKQRVGKSVELERGLYIPLQPSLFEGSFDPRQLLEARGLRRLVWAHLGTDNNKLLKRRLRRGASFHFAVLGVPRPTGDRALVGIHFDGRPESNPLKTGKMTTSNQIKPVLIDRADRKRLLERGGANPELANKSVAVVGVGAVGGYVAEAIARTGIGTLVLVDPDHLLPENMYRHTLGAPRLSQLEPVAALFDASMPVPKARALGTRIKQGLGHLEVHAFDADIFSVLDRALAGVDLVLVAIGNPTVSRGLNLELVARGGPRAVYTWLEPLGVGGHALLTAAPGQSGCYECLFADGDGKELLAPRTDFVAPNQDVLRRVGGCGAAYTPFADLDARRTAELAVRLGVEALANDDPQPRLRSWAGQHQAAKRRGLTLSPRSELSQDQLDADPGAFVHHACLVCG